METSDVFTLFRNKLQQASEDALRYAVSKDDSQARWGHHGWPTLQYFNNGMPRLSEAFGFSGPPDYSRLFDRGPDQDKAPKFPSVDELYEFQLKIMHIVAILHDLRDEPDLEDRLCAQPYRR